MISVSGSAFVRNGPPFVTIALIAVNVIVFLYEMTLNDLDTFRFNRQFGLIPWELTTGETLDVIPVTRSSGVDVESPIPTWGTVFSSMFVHASFMHIMFNMLFLGLFGNYVEARVGHVKYLLLFLATGIAAAWTQVAINQDSLVPLIGASGAVSGIMGAYLLIYPQSFVFMAVYFLAQLFYGIGSLTTVGQGTNVAYMAHVGGFVGGVLLMAGYKRMTGEPIWPRRPLGRWGHWQ